MAKSFKQTVPFSELMQDDEFKIGGQTYRVTRDASSGPAAHRVELEPVKSPRRPRRNPDYMVLSLPGSTLITLVQK